MLALLAALARIALVQGAIEVSGLEGRDLSREDREALLRVTVHDPERPNAERPPVVGSYEVEAGVLRFRPMFPFASGMIYRVELSASGAGVHVELVTVPAATEEPTTTVVAVYPTADVLPENQLKLYLHFSGPMSGGDGLRFVRLLEEGGAEVRDPFLPLGAHFWDSDRRRYTIFFDPGRVKRGILPNEELGRPLEAGKRYRLLVDRAWPDENGLPLAAPHEKRFTAVSPDETPLDPASWKLTSPRPGTREPFSVEFGEPLDRELLRRALAVEDGSAKPLRGTVEVSRSETRWAFHPESLWAEGVYALVVLGFLEDLAGNRIGRPFEVDVFQAIDSPVEKESYRISFKVSGAKGLVNRWRTGLHSSSPRARRLLPTSAGAAPTPTRPSSNGRRHALIHARARKGVGKTLGPEMHPPAGRNDLAPRYGWAGFRHALEPL